MDQTSDEVLIYQKLTKTASTECASSNYWSKVVANCFNWGIAHNQIMDWYSHKLCRWVVHNQFMNQILVSHKQAHLSDQLWSKPLIDRTINKARWILDDNLMICQEILKNTMICCLLASPAYCFTSSVMSDIHGNLFKTIKHIDMQRNPRMPMDVNCNQ